MDAQAIAWRGRGGEVNIDLGNIAQWASAFIAAGSLVVAILGYRKAGKASREAISAKLEIKEIGLQVANISIQSGGTGGSGGQFGGGGGGGGGSGQRGGDGGDFNLRQSDQ